MVDVGLGEAELMSNHCEALAGMPAMPSFKVAADKPRIRRTGGFACYATCCSTRRRNRADWSRAPPAGRRGGGRPPLTPRAAVEQMNQARGGREMEDSTSADTWKAVRKKFNDAGIDVALLCYNMNDNMKDEDIEYGFQMAKGLGVKAMTTSTTLTMAKRIAPIVDKYNMKGLSRHDATSDFNQTATLESYDTLMAYGSITAST